MATRRGVALGLGMALCLLAAAPVLAGEGRTAAPRAVLAIPADWIADLIDRVADRLPLLRNTGLSPTKAQSGGVMDPTGGQSSGPGGTLPGPRPAVGDDGSGSAGGPHRR